MSQWRSPAVIAAAFVVFCAIDLALLRALPITGGEISVSGAVAVAVVANLALLAVARWAAAPLGASRLDWLTAGMFALGALGIVIAGLANKRVVITPSQHLDANARAVRSTVERQAPPTIRDHLDRANLLDLSETTFRTCIPLGESRDRAWCVVVDTSDEKRPIVRSAGPAESNYKVAERIATTPRPATGR